MRIGVVTGSVWATRKTEKLTGLKFLVVALETAETEQPAAIVAADNVGAGEGDRVLVSFGSSARMAFDERKQDVPVDAAIVGILDEREN